MMGRLLATRRIATLCATVLASGWTLAAQQREAAQIPKGSNTLFGRVVDVGTGAPIAGAQVTIMAYGGTAPPPTLAFYGRGLPASADTSAPRGVIAGANGEFLFGELPAGRYALFASAFGYLNGAYLAPTTSAPAHLIDVTDGDRSVAVVVRLVKGASISGTVVDDRGDPVVDAPVQAIARVAGQLQSSGSEARTDDRGVYRIAPLPPGSYVVGVVTAARTISAGLASSIDATASDPFASFDISRNLIATLELDLISFGPGHVPSGEGTRVGDWVLQRKGPTPPPAPDGRLLAYTPTLYPGTAVASEATAVTVGSGEERTGIDMSMRLVPAVTISGLISGPGGPIANASVRLDPTHGGDDRDGSPTAAFTTITTASGAFAFVGVPQGQYLLNSSYFMPEDVNAGTPAVSVWGQQVLAAGDRDLSGLTLALRPGIRVSGRVEYRGAPPQTPERLSVLLIPVRAIWQRNLDDKVGSDGRFVSDGNPPGRYRVSFRGSGSVLAISAAGQPLPDHSLLLDSRDIADLLITVTSAPLHLTGSIVDANGTPATHANVIAFPADTTTWRQGVLSERRRCVVAAASSGAFDCVGLSPGEYCVAAIDAQTMFRVDDPAFLDRLIPGATRVALTGSGAAQVALKLFTPKEP
jgi:hypothetical protein